jgi:hypothetical protein
MSAPTGTESSPPPNPNWYYCADSTTVVGPLSEAAMLALRRCGTITDDSQIVAQGSSEWTTYRKIFGAMAPTIVPQASEATGLSGWTGRLLGTAATLTRAAAAVPRKKAVAAVLAIVLVTAVGARIHSKIERERAGREFRERVIAERGGRSSSEDYFARESEKAKRFLNETGDMVGDKYRIPCDQCDGYGQVGYRCDECRGLGVIVRGSGTELACPGCAGRGRIGRTCSKCNGEGKVLSDKPY